MKQILVDLWRFMTFRTTAEEFDGWGLWHFVLGLGLTWAVGIARNWDYPDASFAARLGSMSVAYVFVLALVLFLFAWPISDTRRSYWHVLTMVVLTAGPGLIYGIPVESWVGGTTAQQLNLAFLAVVATWRVALAFFYFVRACDCGAMGTFAVLATPIFGIVVSLIATGRAGYVMELMGGMNRDSSSANYEVDNVIAVLGCFAYLAAPIALLVYIVTAVGKWLTGDK